MVRLLVSALFAVIASAIGLIVADALLDDMSLTASGFVIAVLIFSVVLLLIEPFIQKVALTKATALRGSTALVATFVALVVTAIASDSLNIDGATTWLLATIIVWGVGLLAAVVLPLVLFKNIMQGVRANRA
jgi:putative membrane protein